MPSQTRLLLTGDVLGVNGADPTRVELWASDSTAVAFAGGRQVGVLTSLAISWTDDRRLLLSGVGADGFPTAWEATDPERIATRWAGARISWPSGKVSTGATVTGSNHGVQIHHDGETTNLPAARLAAVGSQRWIIDGVTRILASDGRGCGCGGRKR